MLVYCAILSDDLVIINVRNADDRCHHMLFFPDSINSLTFHITVTARIRLFFSFASLWFNIVRHLRDNFLFTLVNASAWWKTLHKKPNIEFFSPKFTRNTKKNKRKKSTIAEKSIIVTRRKTPLLPKESRKWRNTKPKFELCT